MKIIASIIPAFFIMQFASCSLSEISYRNESKRTIWVYGYGETTPIRGCGILCGGGNAGLASEDINKFNSDTRVMWTFYEGAATDYFYNAKNPAHYTSPIKNNRKSRQKITLLVFSSDHEWVMK